MEFDSDGKSHFPLKKNRKAKIQTTVSQDYNYYDNNVVKICKRIKTICQRRKLEITDLNKIYLEKGELDVELLGQGFTWLDTGTHESLVEATNFVKTVRNTSAQKDRLLRRDRIFKSLDHKG